MRAALNFYMATMKCQLMSTRSVSSFDKNECSLGKFYDEKAPQFFFRGRKTLLELDRKFRRQVESI
jgi:hypothetical protein